MQETIDIFIINDNTGTIETNQPFGIVELKDGKIAIFTE